MLKTIWTTVLYQPLYNAFILLLSVMPMHDLGLAIIALTLIIKLVLFPLNQRIIVSQMRIAALQPELDAIKKGGASKTEQARLTQELYKSNKINPFASCLPLILQIVVLIALYAVFRGVLHIIAVPALYSFVHAPETIHTMFLGFIDLSLKHNLIFVALVVLSQYFQMKVMQSRQAAPTGDDQQAQFARSLQSQMTYTTPILMGYISYIFPAALALYLTVSNLFAIFQEMYTVRKYRAAGATVVIK